MASIKPRRWALGCGAAVALALSAAALAAPNDVGVASAIAGDVRVQNNGAKQAHQAVLREHLALADRVSTGARSQLQVLLLDKSVFTVGANARLTIDRFVYDAKGSSVSASVAKGAFRFLSGGRGHAGAGSSIKTPVATIGIRGTIIDGVVGPEAVAIARGENKVPAGLAVDPAVATLVVLRGPGALARGNVTPGAITVTAGGTTVELDQPLLAVFVPARGAEPIGPFKISLPGLGRLNDLILPRTAANLPGGGAMPYYPPGTGGRLDPFDPFSDPNGPGGPNERPGGPGYTIPGVPIPPTRPAPNPGAVPAPQAAPAGAPGAAAPQDSVPPPVGGKPPRGN